MSRLQFYVRGVETKARAEKLIEVLMGEKPSVCKMSDGEDDDQRHRQTRRGPGPMQRA